MRIITQMFTKFLVMMKNSHILCSVHVVPIILET